LAAFHKERINKLRKLLEDDLWTPCDINFDYYEILFFIFGMKISEPDEVELRMSMNLAESQLDESYMLNNSIAYDKNGKS
jgi:hypothetical protein